MAAIPFRMGKRLLERSSATAGRCRSTYANSILKELGKRKIPIHYDIEDSKQDLETIENLNMK